MIDVKSGTSWRSSAVPLLSSGSIARRSSEGFKLFLADEIQRVDSFYLEKAEELSERFEVVARRIVSPLSLHPERNSWLCR